MITKDGKDLPIEQLTPDNYLVPKGEERFYHAVIEVKSFDPKTGARRSRPRLQKFGKKMFEAHIHASLLKQGFDILILHNPTEWAAQTKAERAALAKAKAEAEKAEQQKRFDEAVAAAVAKALAAKEAEAKAAAKAAKKAEKEAKSAGTTTSPETEK